VGADADLPAQTLTYSLVSGPGSVTGDVWSWTPGEADGPGTYTVTVQVSDGSASAQQSFDVTVAEVNQAPVLTNPGTQSATEHVPFTLNLSGSDPDVPAQTLTFGLVSGPSGLTVSSSGTVNWTPGESDGGTSPSVTVSLTDGIETIEQTFTIDVNESNEAPVLAAIGNQSVDELIELTFTASASDSDLPAQTLTFSLDPGAPAGASITTGGVFTWTPTEAQGPGVYPVTVRVSDGTLEDFETIQITVNEVNVAPVLDPIGNQTVDELTLLTFTATASDSDLPAQTLTFSLDSGAPSGASITTGGLFTWTPTEAQGPGTYLITVRVSDGALEDFEVISVQVNEVVEAPVATSDSYTTNSNTPLNVAAPGVLQNDSDPNPLPLTAVLVSGPTVGSLTLNPDGSFIYSPPLNYVGAASFTYKANNGTLDSNVVTVTIDVQMQAPVAVADSYNAQENQVLNVPATGVLTNDNDPQGLSLTAVLVSGPSHGMLNLNPDGSFDYTPDANYDGPDSFTYKANNGTLDSNTVTVTITVENLTQTIEGNLFLQDWLPTFDLEPVTFEIRPVGNTTPLEVQVVTLQPNGDYAFDLNTVLPIGTYDITAKASHWLRQKVGSVTITATGVLVNFSLINGDCDGDNRVDSDDFDILVDAFGTYVGDPGYDARADLNGDGEINSDDFDILVAHFGFVGDN